MHNQKWKGLIKNLAAQNCVQLFLIAVGANNEYDF
jgi:hypothetical protein